MAKPAKSAGKQRRAASARAPAPGAAQQLAALADELARHHELYYRAATPELSDAEYDDLVDRYEVLADALGVPAHQRVTRTVGDDHSEGFVAVRHREAMLSLEKANTEAGFFTVEG